MNLRNISIQKRLIAGNFAMILIPLIVMGIVGAGLLGLLRNIDPNSNQQSKIMWPNQTESVAISFALSSLQADMDDPNHEMKRILQDTEQLERHGVATAIIQNGNLQNRSENLSDEQYMFLTQIGDNTNSSFSTWTEKGLLFRYVSSHDNIIVVGLGKEPFTVGALQQGTVQEQSLWSLLSGQTGLITMIIGALVIIGLGIYLSRILYVQILAPLKSLQYAARRIEMGDFDTPVIVSTRDELGTTLEVFDEMRQKLKESQELQNRYEQNRKELVAGISHDLATPLTMIKGYASGIKDGIANTPEKQLGYVNKIYDTSVHMEELVQDLFLISKLDMGRLEFEMTTVSLRKFFVDWMKNNVEIYHDRGLSIEIFTTMEEDANISVDTRQFKRVVDNIMGNALKYKQDLAGKMELTLNWGDEIGNTVLITFADNGPGVAPEDLPRLFDSFYRTDKARSNAHNGSGLGLSIVKQLVEGMNGTIVALPTEGGGLTMAITLPVVDM